MPSSLKAYWQERANDVQHQENVPDVREAVYYGERHASPEELFRLHFADREHRAGPVLAIFNWLASYCTIDIQPRKEKGKRKVRPLVNGALYNRQSG